MATKERLGNLADVTRERDRLLMVLQSMGDAEVCTDATRAITFFNKKAEQLTGCALEDALGMPITSILHLTKEGDPQVSLDPARDCVMTGETQISERGTILTGRNGAARHVGFSVAMIGGPSGDQHGAVLIFNDISEVRAEEKKLAHTASHDLLTDLPNRVSFLASLTHWVKSAKQGQETHCLCFIDLDRFKQVNDTGGHAAGDAVLKEVAQIIVKTCPAGHIAARLGGDEFAVLMPNCESPAVEWTANRIINEIRKTDFKYADQTFRIGASIGATVIDRESPELSEILHQADMACYAAKERGRNRLSIYNGRRHTMIGNLSNAIRAKGL